MNPRNLSASDFLLWGIVLHAIADFPLQNDWMANNKALRRPKFRKTLVNYKTTAQPEVPSYIKTEASSWWDRHPAGFVHAGIHGLIFALIFGWVAIPIAVAHYIIDLRWPVVLWSKLIRQTQPGNRYLNFPADRHQSSMHFPLWDAGNEVRIWTDQVFHIVCIAVAALLISS